MTKLLYGKQIIIATINELSRVSILGIESLPSSKAQLVFQKPFP